MPPLLREALTLPLGWQEVLSILQRALGVWQRSERARHPRRAETLHSLAQLREAQGNLEEARIWYEQALALREQTLGAHHSKTRQTRQRLSALLQAMGQHEQAAQLEVVQSG